MCQNVLFMPVSNLCQIVTSNVYTTFTLHLMFMAPKHFVKQGVRKCIEIGEHL